MPNMRPPPPRSTRPAKRPLVEDHIGADSTDEEWTPEQSTTKSPAPLKTRASKPSPSVSKVKSGHTEITVQIKPYYLSERGHPVLSGRWWQEITKKPEFWRDFKKYVALGTMKQRFSTSVCIDDIHQPASALKPVTRKKTSSSTKPVVDDMASASASANAATGDTITAIQKDDMCDDCGKEFQGPALSCDACLALPAQDDDGFGDTVVFKAQGEAQNELSERPFGGEGDPIKLEDDIKCEESEGEEDKFATSLSVVRDEMRTLITLDDGSQYIMINGVMKPVKSKVKIPWEA